MIALNSSPVAARKDGKKNAPGQGRPEKPQGETVVRKNVSLYPWEWKELQQGSEGPTEAVRRILKERREKDAG